MIVARLELLRAADNFAARAGQLRERIAAGEDVWPQYGDAVRALAAVLAVPDVSDARGTLTSRELSERLGVSQRTLQRRRARGELEPVKAGGRGRSHLWSAEAAQ